MRHEDELAELLDNALGNQPDVDNPTYPSEPVMALAPDEAWEIIVDLCKQRSVGIDAWRHENAKRKEAESKLGGVRIVLSAVASLGSDAPGILKAIGEALS